MTHASITFDTFHHAKRLRRAGYTEKQVEAQIDIIKEQTTAINNTINNDLATKNDLRELELRMSIKLGGIMISGLGALVILLKLFNL